MAGSLNKVTLIGNLGADPEIKTISDNVEVWGSGGPLREFLHVDDLATAVLYSIENRLPDSIYNVGSGEEIAIKNLAILVKSIIGFGGEIIYDTVKPDGTQRKLMDSRKINQQGWNSRINLKEGISRTYKEYKIFIDAKIN